MFRKKKRKLELSLPDDRKQESPNRDDERTVSRRVLLMRGGFALGFATLAGKLWHMEIAQGSNYSNVAEDNVLRFERIDAPRGRILDSTGKPLATNRRAWTVKLIPPLLPDDEMRRQEILGTLSETLAMGQALVLDQRRIPEGSEAAVVKELEDRLGVKGDPLLAELERPGVFMALVREPLKPEEGAALLEQVGDQPGVRVMNMIDYYLAANGGSDRSIVLAKDVDREVAMAIAANTNNMPGVEVNDETLIREYPGGAPFSHVLGYVGPITQEEYEAATDPTGESIYDPDDVVGRGGVEEAMQDELRGEKGGRWVQVDATGVERFELVNRRREAVPGKSVQLTIDRDFQIAVTEALQAGIEYANVKALEDGRKPVGSGVAIAINPQNGDLRALVSLPNYDNQLFINGITNDKYQELVNDPFKPLLNRAIAGTYAPGSTFKPLMAAMGLQEEIVNPDTTFDCHGTIRVPWTWDESQGNEYLCWVGTPGHGPVDIYHALSDSCDIYFYNLGAPHQKPSADIPNADWLHYYNPNSSERQYFHGLGIDRIAEYLNTEFGFGQPTGIELAGEASGLVPTPAWLNNTFEDQYWSVGDTINVSIGQGHLLCTPLQLLNATAAIANGGTLWRPRVIKALVDENGEVTKEFTPQPLRKLGVKAEHLKTIREGMRMTITEGTGSQEITVTDPHIAGKSGTAEHGVAVNGLYAQSHAWFTAFGPYENPEIAIAVMIVNGDAGSTYAGPVANDILKAYFKV